ncbi:MAG TPA: MBL fold metallo-hydrolase [Thermoanaerobaculia bacterium]|jgi:phosphoribosyl 1,2-cyclic phosphodiesterase|nr:MBL fold metallo-hydrolase [Thermoanaerobaculia bacterium]
MRVAVLGSGSAGNCLVVESAGRRILIDAGFSCREVEARCRRVGVAPETVEAVIVTHEHNDHSLGADRLARRLGLAVYATEGTLKALHWSRDARPRLHSIAPGWPYEIAGFEVEAFPVPHDAADPVGVVVTDRAGARVGFVSDLGCWSRLAGARLRDVDLLVLEANHDLDMLRRGPYPWVLKQRVASRHGHLSNQQAAEALPELVSDRLRSVVLYHLSRSNNEPALAVEAVSCALDRLGSTALVTLTEQSKPSSWMEVSQ